VSKCSECPTDRQPRWDLQLANLAPDQALG
jgi:hypothetical protein